MADKIAAQTDKSLSLPTTEAVSTPKSFDFEQFIEQMMDPDGVVVSVGAKSDGGTILGIPFEGGIVGVQAGYNQQDGFAFETNGKVTPKTEEANITIGGKDIGVTLGGRFGLPGIDGINTPTVGGDAKVKIGDMEFEVREGFDVETGSKFRTYQMSLPDHLAKQMPEKIEKALDKLPDRARDLIAKVGRGPAGLVTDMDAKIRITEEFRQDGQVVTYSGLQLEVSPSESLSIDGVLDLDAFKVVAQVDGVFMTDEFDGAQLPPESGITAFNPEQPFDTYDVLNPQTQPDDVGIVELSPRQSVMVTADGRTVAGVETMRSETAMALRGVVREAMIADYEAKAENAGSDAERIENEAVAGAIRGGASIREAQNLGVDVRAVQTFYGDTRNADALVGDSRDNGVIDGSNLPEARIGDETYAVSTGGGVMHGRTTMTPGEIAARANAHAAHGGEVETDAVAKAQADAMAQSLREGFSVKEQIATGDPTAAAPGEAAAAVRQQLEAMIDDQNGAALAGQERKALEGMIAEARKIEEAVKFEGAVGLADNEYAVVMQMQERQALDNMIAEAQKLDELTNLPIPEFRPDLPRQKQPDGPDMRGDAIAYGRGTIENGPAGKNVAYDSFNDWTNDVRDMFSGSGPKEGVATPNAAELGQQEAEKKDKTEKDEGGENKGQRNDIPEAGSKENDAATSAEFDAMGGITADPDSDTSTKEDNKSSSSKRDDHEGGENRGQQGPTESEKSEFGGSASGFSGSSGIL